MPQSPERATEYRGANRVGRETRGGLLPKIGGLQDVIQFLGEYQIPLHLDGGFTFGPDLFDELATIMQRFTPVEVEQRLAKYVKTSRQEDPLVRLVASQIRKLGFFKEMESSTRFSRRVLKRTSIAVANSLLERVVTTKTPRELVPTPREFIPTPAPTEEILTPKTLQDTLEFVALSEHPESVAHQLMDPLDLTLNGLTVETRPEKNGEMDFTLPVLLSEILRTLKHRESEEIFKSWLLEQCKKSDEDIQDTIRFLKVLVNFTTFLDSPTHFELWRPPFVDGREPELLLQPFEGLLNSVQLIRDTLAYTKPQYPTLQEFDNIEALIKLRYWEVFNDRNLSSAYTVGYQALVPTSEGFADLALSLVNNHNGNGRDTARTAVALVKLAETIGIEDVAPLIAKLNSDSPLGQAVLKEAQRAGFIPSPEALPQVLTILEKSPWRDAADVNFAKIITPGITTLEVRIFTGTFGPFTKGHKDLLETLLTYLNSLPEHTGQGEGKIQRLVLIVPVTDVRKIPYGKSAAQIGTVEERVSSILLQLAGSVDKQKVFITTQLQPDPAATLDLKGRVQATFYEFVGKIASDLRKNGRAADFQSKLRFAMGPDELNWEDNPRRLANIQRSKAMELDGIVIGRRGWTLAIIRNHEALPKKTNIKTVIFTPGTPHSSSTKVIEEIAQKGYTRAVEAGAGEYVNSHWSPHAIRSRDTSEDRLLHTMSDADSVTEISKRLSRNL